MADLSKISLNGTVYNFKDAEAREALEGLGDLDNLDLSGYVEIERGSALINNDGDNNGIILEYEQENPYYLNKVHVGPRGTIIDGLVTPTSNLHAANKAYVDSAVSSATTTVTQTLTSGTKIGEVNSTSLYAPSAYDDTALANRVSALENLPWVTYYTGASTPSSSLGNDGDIYLQTS